jgi:poly-beta-1,6-N-acetyl-D-glucosamine N-deacetylase
MRMIKLVGGLLNVLSVLMVGAANAQEPSPSPDSHAIVLMYHRFGESKYPSTNTTLEQLDTHIAYLRENKFNIAPLSDVVAALRAGRALPPKTVALTIDDAYRSVVTQAWPRFKRAGFPFTVFVATEAVDQKYADIMSWDDVRALHADGVTIGAHSHAHPHLPALSADQVRADIAAMNTRFRAELKFQPSLYAYPYGEGGREDIDIIRESGFVAAFGQNSGPAYAQADPHLLPRFALNETYGAMDRFALITNSKPLRAINIQPRDPVLRANPPTLSFDVVEPPGPLAGVSCFGPRGERLPVEAHASTVTVTPKQAFPSGRARVNCTLNANRTWFWFGQEFLANGLSEGVRVHARYRN